MHSLVIILILTMTSVNLAIAEDVLGPERLEDFGRGKLTAEVVERVEGVEMAYLNFEALRTRFPDLERMSDQEISELMIWNLSFVGSEQKKLNGIRNSPIVTDPSIRSVAYRPKGWVRAGILPIFLPHGKLIGYLEGKGFGHGARSGQTESPINGIQVQLDRWEKASPTERDNLKNKGHSDGLMSLGEAFAEAIRQKAIQRLMDLEGTGLETVETYAIMRYPFNILKNGKVEPAALYFRSLNSGNNEHGMRLNGLPASERFYFDRSGNYQFTSSFSGIDFGGVLVKDRRLENNFAGDPAFPQDSLPWQWAHKAAQAFVREDNPDKRVFERHLSEMLAPLNSESMDSENILSAKVRRQKLRKQIAHLRSQGVSYQEIVNQLAPWKAIIQGLFSGDQLTFSLAESLSSFLRVYSGSNWTELELYVRTLTQDPEILNLFHTKKIEKFSSNPKITLVELENILASGNGSTAHAVGLGLAANPNLAQLLSRRLINKLGDSGLEALVRNYVDQGQASASVHRLIMMQNNFYQHIYIERLLNTPNEFPWKEKLEGLKAKNAKPRNYAKPLGESPTTPHKEIIKLMSSKDATVRAAATLGMLSNPTTPNSTLKEYAQSSDPFARATAQLNLSIRLADDYILGSLHQVSKKVLSSGRVSCSLLFN